MAPSGLTYRAAAAAQIIDADLAAWLIVAPAVLGYGDTLRIADQILGPIGASSALVAAWETTRGVRRVNVVTGALLIVAPWLFRTGVAATSNSMAVGIAMILLALCGHRVHGRFDGGWIAVWRPVRCAKPLSVRP